MIDSEKIVKLIDRLIVTQSNYGIESDSLSHGRISLSIALSYAGAFLKKEEYSRQGLQLLEEVFSNIESGKSSLQSNDFYSGLLGLLSVLNNLKSSTLIDIDLNDFEPIEEAIHEWTLQQLKNKNIDFFYGAMGSLSYYGTRLEEKRFNAHVDEIIDIITHQINEHPAYKAIINRLYNRMDNRYSNEINFSLAHGMSSVIVNLINLKEAGYSSRDLSALISSLTNFIVDASKSEDIPEPHCFIGSINTDDKKINFQKRIGWCFSELNILQILFKGSVLLNDNSWLKTALLNSRKILGRTSYPDTLAKDPFLCHGYSGIAHYYLHLYSLSNRKEFITAHEYWINETLNFFETMPDGYFESPEFKKTNHIHSLFYGIPGVILCLLSAYNPKSSNWSKIILL